MEFDIQMFAEYDLDDALKVEHGAKFAERTGYLLRKKLGVVEDAQDGNVATLNVDGNVVGSKHGIATTDEFMAMLDEYLPIKQDAKVGVTIDTANQSIIFSSPLFDNTFLDKLITPAVNGYNYWSSTAGSGYMLTTDIPVLYDSVSGAEADGSSSQWVTFRIYGTLEYGTVVNADTWSNLFNEGKVQYYALSTSPFAQTAAVTLFKVGKSNAVSEQHIYTQSVTDTSQSLNLNNLNALIANWDISTIWSWFTTSNKCSFSMDAAAHTLTVTNLNTDANQKIFIVSLGASSTGVLNALLDVENTFADYYNAEADDYRFVCQYA